MKQINKPNILQQVK